MGAIVVTVHGTNDGAEADSGEQWWQTDSGFCRRFSALGAERGVDLDVRPFHWDGANSDVARRSSGRRLAQMLHRVLRDAGEVNVVGHSHGGNVIAYALDDPWLWRAYQQGRLRVVSVGTPFFAGRRRWVSTINEIGVRTILSIVAIAAGLLGAWLAGMTDRLWIDGRNLRNRVDSLVASWEAVLDDTQTSQLPGLESAILLGRDLQGLAEWMIRHPFYLFIGAVIALTIVLGPLLLRSLMQLGARAADVFARRERPTWRVVAHPADEAIALLAATPRTRLNPMTPSGAARSVRRLTPLPAIMMALLASALIWSLAPSALRNLPDQIAEQNEASLMEVAWREATIGQDEGFVLPHRWSREDRAFIVSEEALALAAANNPERRAELEQIIAAANEYSEQVEMVVRESRYTAIAVVHDLMLPILLILMIVALLAIWLIQLIVVAASPLLGRGMSFFANRSVTGAMTGAALGEDGEYLLRSVSAAPPSRFAAREIALSEATVDQMYLDADRHAGESLRRMRRTIGTAPERTTGDAFGDLLAQISWRELIHTSYFESEEVAVIVLDGVAPNAPPTSIRAAA